MVRARFEDDPGFVMIQDEKAYKAAFAKGMLRLEDREPQPTEIEARVARAVVATRGTDRHGLALAMAEALERGTTATADGILKERAAVLAELQEDWPKGEHRIERSVRKQALMRRVCRNFTGAEVREMCEGKGPVMDWLPGDAARTRVRETMLGLHRDTWSSDPSPWRGRRETLAREFGLVREDGPERDRGMYPEIERW